jgi:hypothetical protein
LVLLPSDAREAVSPDRTVALGIRPEDVRVAHDSVYLFDGESGSLVWTEKRPEQEQLTTV